MPDVGAGFRTALIHHLADLHYVWLHGPGCGQPGYRSLTRLDCGASPFTPPIGAIAEKAARLTGGMACHTVATESPQVALIIKTKTVLLESVSSLEQITMLDRECRDAITEATCVLWAPRHMPCLVLALRKWDGDEGAALAACRAVCLPSGIWRRQTYVLWVCMCCWCW